MVRAFLILNVMMLRTPKRSITTWSIEIYNTQVTIAVLKINFCVLIIDL